MEEKDKIWLLSHIPMRILSIAFLVIDFLLYSYAQENGIVSFKMVDNLLYVSIALLLLFLISIPFMIKGAKLGKQYVDMGVSRHWKYHNTEFSSKDNTFRNVVYWTCKIGLIPLAVALIALCIVLVLSII